MQSRTSLSLSSHYVKSHIIKMYPTIYPVAVSIVQSCIWSKCILHGVQCILQLYPWQFALCKVAHKPVSYNHSALSSSALSSSVRTTYPWQLSPCKQVSFDLYYWWQFSPCKIVHTGIYIYPIVYSCQFSLCIVVHKDASSYSLNMAILTTQSRP